MTDLGAAMVRAGWAIAYGDYRDEEQVARRARAGIWAGEFIEPNDWRVLHGQAAADFSFWQRWFRPVRCMALAPVFDLGTSLGKKV